MIPLRSDGLAHGYNVMPRIVAAAPADIRQHLWSLYWLCRVAESLKPMGQLRVVELGVREGDSTRALMAGIRDVAGYLYSFDCNDCSGIPRISSERGCDGLEFERWTFTQSDSVAAAKSWGEKAVDLLFIDTEHTLELTRREIAAWHEKVISVMCFHDSGLTHPGQDGVGPAVREFAASHDDWILEDHPHIADQDCGLAILWKR